MIDDLSDSPAADQEFQDIDGFEDGLDEPARPRDTPISTLEDDRSEDNQSEDNQFEDDQFEDGLYQQDEPDSRGVSESAFLDADEKSGEIRKDDADLPDPTEAFDGHDHPAPARGADADEGEVQSPSDETEQDDAPVAELTADHDHPVAEIQENAEPAESERAEDPPDEEPESAPLNHEPAFGARPCPNCDAAPEYIRVSQSRERRIFLLLILRRAYTCTVCELRFSSFLSPRMIDWQYLAYRIGLTRFVERFHRQLLSPVLAFLLGLMALLLGVVSALVNDIDKSPLYALLAFLLFRAAADSTRNSNEYSND